MNSAVQALRAVRPLALLLAPVLLLGACSGDRFGDVDVDDVDGSTSIAVTDAELAAFRAPTDSVLTEAQVEAYLKTSLLQFDLVRKEGERLYAKGKEIEERAEKGGALAGLRNIAAAGSMLYQWGNTIGGSYIRSARTLGYNPAEMEWVRERMLEVGSYLAMKPMHEAALASAREMKAHAEQLRQGGAAAGFSDDDIAQMIANAEATEQDMRANLDEQSARAVLANVDVLRRARPAVSEPMWTTIGFAGGTMGLASLTGLADPDDSEAQQKLDEFRRLFEDALANRTSEGMEP